MSNRNSKIITHSTIYMIGDILRHSVSLIMLPIYTRYLSTADYGAVELLSMIIDFASIIFGARIAQAIFRFFCATDDELEKKNIMASAYLLGVMSNGLGAIAVAFLSGFLSVAIFSDASFQIYIVLFAVTMFLLPLIEIPLVYIRAQQKPMLFVAYSLMKLLIQLALNLYFVVYREMHVEGVVYSSVISSAVMAFVLFCYFFPKIGFNASIITCKKLFTFSLPLKLAAIGSFYLTFGDRLILKIYTDLSHVGIYSLGYKFGFIFSILAWVPFEKMWDVEKYSIYKRPNAKSDYQMIFVNMSLFLIIIGLGISVLSKDVLRLMSDPAFWGAHEIVPIIIIAYIIQAWTKYCDLGVLINNKTIYIAFAEMIAVVVITAAYFILIPLYGIQGAAYATVVGFLSRLVWITYKSNQFYDMQLPWKKVLYTLVFAISVFIASQFMPEDLLMSIIFKLLLLVAAVIVFFLLPILNKNEKNNLYARLHSFIYVVAGRKQK